MNYGAYAPGDGGAGGAMPALADFQSKDAVGGAQSFLNSNSYVAKAAFLILVVIVFVYVLRFCITVIAYLFAPNSSPFLVNGVSLLRITSTRLLASVVALYMARAIICWRLWIEACAGSLAAAAF